AVVAVLLLFAAFFSAVLLCITSFARSFKEAQAYLIPLMLASLGPGLAGMLPGLRLSDWAAAPLLNVVLLGRDLLERRAAWGEGLVVVISTLLYASAAVAVAARTFGSESVLYHDQTGWADLLRRSTMKRAYPTITAALWSLVLIIPVNFLCQGSMMLLVHGGFLEAQTLVFFGPLQAAVLFALLPAFFAWHGRVAIATGFGCRAAPVLVWLGATALGMGLWPVVLAALRSWQPPVEGSQWRVYAETVAALRHLPVVGRVALVAVAAVLEEWFFRGWLYGALRQRLAASATIVTTALLFGAAHFLLRPELGLQRLLPSFAMGLALGLVRECGGSVGPGMWLHALHNGILVVLLGDNADDSGHAATAWIVIGAAVSVIGFALCWWGRRATVERAPSGTAV
ncbi:MAG: CPBP family intramembrane metalloprotease, partial [Gemmataceae bacterium]|nr:CPBP family intramembrane metalloprotease [Gemmataceae bacterium]